VAVALGLLISSGKTFYDTPCNETTQLAANYILLQPVCYCIERAGLSNPSRKGGATMKTRAVIFICHLLVVVPLFARESTDVIVMQNGDRLTGEVKALDGGVLYVSLPYVVQTLSVDWTKVARLESHQLFFVKTEDGTVYEGVLNSRETGGGRPTEIEIAETPAKTEVISSTRVVNVSQTSEKFLQRFTGGASFGTIYAKANQTAQYSLTGYAGYPRPRWGASAGISSNLSLASGTSTSTRNQLTFSGYHLMRKNNYFYNGFDAFLQSTEQGITHQNAIGATIGRYLKNTDRALISVGAGGAWQTTNYNQGVVPIPTQNVATAVLLANVQLFTFNKTTLNVGGAVFPALSEPGRVYYSTNASYYIKITGNLSWNVSFYGNWDNQPPAKLPGSDYGTTSGLSWTFGTSLRTSPTSIQ
jgi:Protein of unknown function, DUF481